MGLKRELPSHFSDPFFIVLCNSDDRNGHKANKAVVESCAGGQSLAGLAG